MDGVDLFGGCMMIILLAVIIFLTYLIIIESSINPLRAEKANEICRQRGYDQYIDFRTMPFDNKPYAVKCEYITKMNINYNSDKNV